MLVHMKLASKLGDDKISNTHCLALQGRDLLVSPPQEEAIHETNDKSTENSNLEDSNNFQQKPIQFKDCSNHQDFDLILVWGNERWDYEQGLVQRWTRPGNRFVVSTASILLSLQRSIVRWLASPAIATDPQLHEV